MRFWEKIFLSTLLLFLLVFDIGTYILVSYSYDFNLESEIDSALREQTVILSSLENHIASVEMLYQNASKNKERMYAVIAPLANYYISQEIYLALFLEDEFVFSNVIEINTDLLQLEESDSKKVYNKKINDRRYLFVSSKISSFPNLKFVYVRDISALDNYKLNISKVFIILSNAVCFVIGISIFVLLRRLTRPLIELGQTSRKIANGAYEQRVSIRRMDEFGEVGYAFNLMADSIEEKIAKLEQSAMERQYFVDSLAHEIKTPLTSILGYSEYLQNAKSSEEERIIATKHLYNAAERLKNLQAMLLEMTYLRTTGIQKVNIDMEKMLASVIDYTKPIRKKNSLKLITVLENKTIYADETLLLSLLINLVENSARASKPFGEIIIKSYRNTSSIIEVTDYGCGMDKQEIEKITQPFYRVDKSRSRIFGGVGLGLSLCKQIVDLHDARLEIESDLKKGTTVRIILQVDNNMIMTR